MSRFTRERRFAGRHSVKTPLRIRIWKSQIPDATGESLNLSPRGMYFVTETTLREGETVEVFFEMPMEITGESESEWRCTGHVVRIEPVATSQQRFGVGVQFDCYEVSRASQTGEEISRTCKPLRMVSLVP
jgi:Tfp pilus assembly protein PilZ